MADRERAGGSVGRTPGLLQEPRTPVSDRIFRPAVPNRRGEGFAWLSALGMLAVTGILLARTGSIQIFPLLLLLGFGLAAALISFSNWMDRNTQVWVSSEGIHYRSPVRNVHLKWGEVSELRAGQVGGSWRIAVQGDEGSFHFRTATRLGSNTARPFNFGFVEGDALASLIVGGAGLTDLRRGEGTWICRRPGEETPTDGSIGDA